MNTPQDPRNKNNGSDEKITNESDKIVNKQTENVHEVSNEEEWIDDVNKEFGEDPLFSDEEDDDIYE